MNKLLLLTVLAIVLEGGLMYAMATMGISKSIAIVVSTILSVAYFALAIWVVRKNNQR